MKYGSIKIGNNVWIGANVYVGCNVTIGENSIVGANSVVTKDVEANAIYSGIPAKLVRYKKQ
jgi:maltose O-acetyltransferase